MKKYFSPGKTYRRSSVALLLGLMFVVIASIFAAVLEVPRGDLFAGFMAGTGAVAALMAALESADAAHAAADAARQANEIAIRESTPSISLSPVPRYFRELAGHEGYLSQAVIENIGTAYTAINRLNVYRYSNKKKIFIYGTSTRIPCPAGTDSAHTIGDGHLENLRIRDHDGFAIEVFTIHGTMCSALIWVEHPHLEFRTVQLYDAPVPELLPPFPSGPPDFSASVPSAGTPTHL
ncbi:hypothetical protein [Comamonas sp. B-9]|uniref:hypothetical protein n=1 Tax=Comamonas sp. B-9 TaxID=1055192 RepID=UPI0011DCF6D3|nr:hypothetical protein [Comamonas sp. B-9]